MEVVVYHTSGLPCSKKWRFIVASIVFGAAVAGTWSVVVGDSLYNERFDI
jgi:hypothetical protein